MTDRADRVPLAEPAWFAIQTIPCQEGTAASGLRRAGYHVSYAIDRYQVRQRRALGRTIVRWVDKPHFAGYCFLALRFENESLGAVKGVKGVVRVVCRPLSGIPLQIPCAVMDRLLDERLVALDDGRGGIVMSETFLRNDGELRVFLGELGRWRCQLRAA